MIFALIKTSEDPVTYLWAVVPMVFISVWLVMWTWNCYNQEPDRWSQRPFRMWAQFWLGLFVGVFWLGLTLLIGQSPENFQSYIIPCIFIIPGFYISFKRGFHIFKYLKS